MPTLGVDCQVILQHADVNGGVAVGFMLASEATIGGAVSVQRERFDNGDGTFDEKEKFFFSVPCANNVRLPNNSVDARTRQKIYDDLIAFLAKNSGVTLYTPVGVYGSLYCLGHLATENHHPALSVITCQFRSDSDVFAPADPTIYLGSYWDGTYKWDEAYWVEG